MEPTEIVFHPHDLHAFFFGKAIDLVIAERSREALNAMMTEGSFHEYIASIARIMHTQYELSLKDRERTKEVLRSE